MHVATDVMDAGCSGLQSDGGCSTWQLQPLDPHLRRHDAAPDGRPDPRARLLASGNDGAGSRQARCAGQVTPPLSAVLQKPQMLKHEAHHGAAMITHRIMSYQYWASGNSLPASAQRRCMVQVAEHEAGRQGGSCSRCLRPPSSRGGSCASHRRSRTPGAQVGCLYAYIRLGILHTV
jgi:hypothetical protein